MEPRTLVFSKVGEITLVAAQLGQFHQLLKTRVIIILNFTRPHAITYTNTTDQASNAKCATVWNTSFNLFCMFS